jgi:hypothetical protein
MQGKERLETNTKKTNRNLKNVFKFFVFFCMNEFQISFEQLPNFTRSIFLIFL